MACFCPLTRPCSPVCGAGSGFPTKSVCSSGATESGGRRPKHLDPALCLYFSQAWGQIVQKRHHSWRQEVSSQSNYSLAYYLGHCIRTVRMALQSFKSASAPLTLQTHTDPGAGKSHLKVTLTPAYSPQLWTHSGHLLQNGKSIQAAGSPTWDSQAGALHKSTYPSLVPGLHCTGL